MARTKQSARKASKGKAPRQQLATQSSKSFKAFMTSGQSVGAAAHVSASAAAAGKTSIYNYENTLGEFMFNCGPRESTAEFRPRFQTGTTTDEVTGNPQHWLAVNFVSKFDDAGMDRIGRPPLDLVIVLDISGSMSCGFENGGGGGGWGAESSKLGAAKACIKAIMRQLTPADRLGVVLFNHAQHTLIQLAPCGDLDRSEIDAKIDGIAASGGTKLAEGFKAGVDMALLLGKGCNARKRVMFLTDMQSSDYDEQSVLAVAAQAADRVHTSVYGIGVDLSVGTVGRLSGIPGCKYTSVSSTAECIERLDSEFAFDVTPIAYDINIALVGWVFDKGFGSPEVRGLQPGSASVTLSSEFPMLSDPSRDARGAILLFKVRRAASDAAAPLKLTTTWKGMDATRQEDEQAVPMAGPDQSSLDVRKAAALVRYVDLQEEYVLDDRELPVAADPAAQLEALSTHQAWVTRFTEHRAWLLAEIRACGDSSIEAGNNKNIDDTLKQIIQLEEQEVAKVKTLTAAAGAVAAAAAAAAPADGTPHEFLCPITGDLMVDPVLATDGYTYERAAIEQWFASRAGSTRVNSPMTGKLLKSLELLPNMALRTMIVDHVAKVGGGGAPAAAAASPRRASKRVAKRKAVSAAAEDKTGDKIKRKTPK